MEFKEWWKKEGRQVSRMISLITAEDFAKVCYRAGLLHAAEQDDAVSANIIPPDGHIGVQYIRSAAMHRQAAEELK